MKFYGGGQGGKRNNYVNVRGDLGLLRKVNEQKNLIIDAARLIEVQDFTNSYKQVVVINLEYL